MNTKTTLSITEARKNLFDLAEKVQTPSTYYTFTEKGKPKAVLMSAVEFESWQETLEVMQDIPDLKKDIEKVARDLKNGQYEKYSTLEQLVKQEYARPRSTKSKKRA